MMVKIQNGGDVISAFAIRLMLHACIFTLLEIILLTLYCSYFQLLFIFMALMLTLIIVHKPTPQDKVFNVGQR